MSIQSKLTVMKSIFLKPFFYIIILSFAATNCDPFTYQDIAPGISIYKTSSDYFTLTDIGMKGDRIFRTSSYSQEWSKFYFRDNDTIYKYRERLIDGYILDFEADDRYDVFLNLSFKECMNLEVKYNQPCLLDDTLRNYIIDKDPYIEYYRDMANPRLFSHIVGKVDTSEINQIIRDGKLEQYFTRLK